MTNDVHANVTNGAPVRVGIIGLGSWGSCHLEAYASLPEVQVVALCDMNASRVSELGQKYHVANLYTNPNQLFEHDDIDLVSVVTFENQHLDPVLGALKSGKHVLVEKPVATTVEEAREMYRVAQEQGRFIAPGHLLRFDPRYAQIRSSLDGTLGPAQSIFLKRSRQRSLFTTYQRTHTVYELTVHDLDLAIWYAGSRVSRVRAYGKSVLGGAVPDLLWACLEFENGVIAVLESNWLTPDEVGVEISDSVEVIGKNGIAQFNTTGAGPEIWHTSGRVIPDYHIHSQVAGQTFGALRSELQYICGSIRRGEVPSYISFPDAIHTVEVAKAIVGSIESGKEYAL